MQRYEFPEKVIKWVTAGWRGEDSESPSRTKNSTQILCYRGGRRGTRTPKIAAPYTGYSHYNRDQGLKAKQRGPPGREWYVINCGELRSASMTLNWSPERWGECVARCRAATSIMNSTNSKKLMDDIFRKMMCEKSFRTSVNRQSTQWSWALLRG